MGTKRIGEYLVERKVLTPSEVEQVLEYGRREGLRFGEAGTKLGLLSEESLVKVFGKNYRVDFFHLDARYFPRQTQALISIESVLRYGVLPLGVKTRGLFGKRKVLNLGMLDPGRLDAVAAVQREAQGVSGTQVFLVLADQFLEVLRSVYGLTEAQIAAKAQAELDPTLTLFLDERI